MKNKAIWENHYTKKKSLLLYPDENLVRLLSKKAELIIGSNTTEKITVADIGCGSGRHCNLLESMGFQNIIATDMSRNSLNLVKEVSNASTTECFNDNLPFKNKAFDIIVAWGSLHYCDKSNSEMQIKEIHRVLKPGALFFGTLRSSYDSHLKNGIPDLEDAIASFFTLEEVNQVLSIFSSASIGLITRTPPGKLDQTIAHWYFEAQK